jgi:hypothetical protein
MNVTINAGKIGKVDGDLGIRQRIEEEITFICASMDGANESKRDLLVGKLSTLLLVRDGMGSVAAYEQALATWEAARKP